MRPVPQQVTYRKSSFLFERNTLAGLTLSLFYFLKSQNLLNCTFFICGDQVARSLGFEDTISMDIDELL